MRAYLCFGAFLAVFAVEAVLGAGTRGLGPFFAWDALAIVVGGTVLIVVARFSPAELSAARANERLAAEKWDFAARSALKIGVLSSLLYVAVALQFEEPAFLVRRIGVGLTGAFFGGVLSLFLGAIAERTSAAASGTPRAEPGRRHASVNAPR
ncbi:MAG: hypothetical protein M0D55_02750 [Elusimicrobiota bacterium]|nr:MAG: hypothetical protein M0D55_02750 [Elusimicrobiota bacterium]